MPDSILQNGVQVSVENVGTNGSGQPIYAMVPAGCGDVIDVLPTLDTSAYADGDVLFNPTAITNAVRVAGSRAWLKNVTILDESDQGMGLDLIFLDTANNLGTLNAAPDITDANARKIIGRVQVSAADFYDLGGCRIADVDVGGKLLKAAAETRDLYVAAISRGTGTYAASGLRLKLAFAWD